MSRDERDAVADAVAALADYMARLEGLAPEPAAPGVVGPAVHSRPAIAPEPYGPAGRALMTAFEGVRRLEAWLRQAALGHPGLRRGCSPGNTDEALAMIVKFASQVDDERFARACSALDRWIGDARSVHGIDENRRWRHLPRQGDPDDPAALPPQCPYCKTFFLVYDPDARLIACSLYGCEDGNGDPPTATLDTDDAGRPRLAWQDGKKQLAPAMDAAAA